MNKRNPKGFTLIELMVALVVAGILMGVLVGLSMYLPIIYILTYGIGCLINMGLTAVKGKTWSEEWGVPFCAGLIVGEAVLALVINALVLCMG